MPLFKEDAIKDLNSLQDRMNRLFTESLKRIKEFAEQDETKPWSPAVDIFETPDSFILLADLPGVVRGAVSVEVQGAALTIKGERVRPSAVLEADLHRSERQYRAFARSFNLPASVNQADIKANLAEGVSTVIVAKPTEEASAVKIAVE